MYELDVLTLRLLDGRSIRLERLDQRLTYAGVLAGLPTDAANRSRVQWALNAARDDLPGAPQPVLIPPSTDTREGPDGASHPFLPAVTCIGRFASAGAAGGWRSTATLVWFQSRYAPPIATEVVEAIAALDWARASVDEEY